MGGRCCSRERDHLSPGPGRTLINGTGWDATRHERTGQGSKTQVCTRRRQNGTGQDKLDALIG